MNAGEASLEAVAARAAGAFADRFGARPTFAACAPGRVNLIGDHTDYTGGLALPMAIDRWCVAVGGLSNGPADRGPTTILAADLGETRVLHADASMEAAAAALPAGDWSRYAAGVMAEFESVVARPIPAINVAIASSVPIGCGLSSSAALEVAMATMLEAATGATLDPMEKARLCQRAEHRWAGVNCGLMDQMAAVLGRKGCALYMDFTEFSAQPVPLPEGCDFLVVNSGVERRLAAGAYGALVESCERARAALGLGSLREATPELALAHEETLDWELYRRVYHVATENARVAEAARSLRDADLDRLGALMIESHQSLMAHYGVSCVELDSLVDIVTGFGYSLMHGVYGARMTGAGFGGCIVAAVAPWAARAAAVRLRERYLHRHGRACDVFQVRAAGGARPLTI